MSAINERHAIVLGSSFAGMFTACVLSDEGWRVTLVEKADIANNAGDSGTSTEAVRQRLRGRKGVPQARHLHTLLAGGAKVVEELLPGVLDEIVEAGGEHMDFCSAKAYKSNMGGLWRTSKLAAGAGIDTVLCSRPLIEEVVRRRTLAKARVQLRSGEKVAGLLGSSDGISGVRLSSGEAIHASLTIDATGRGSRCEKWAVELGAIDAAPEVEVVDPRVTYADALMRPPDSFLETSDWRVLRVEHALEPRYDERLAGLRPSSSGIIYEVEGGLWCVGLAGYAGEVPPREPEAWKKYARSLPDPAVWDAIKDAELLSPVNRISATRNQRRRWDKLTRPAAGLIAIGDAIVAPNPIFGQGMSMAAFSARAARGVLADLSPNLNVPHDLAHDAPLDAATCASVHSAIIEASSDAWTLASSADAGRVALEAEGAEKDTSPASAFLQKMFEAEKVDAEVSIALNKVLTLLSPLSALAAPNVVLRTLAAQPTTKTEPPTSLPFVIDGGDHLGGQGELAAKLPVVFIHGWPDNHKLFEDQSAALAANGRACVRVCLPNALPGCNNNLGYAGYVPEALEAVDINRALQAAIEAALGADAKFVIAAHDWGVPIALNLANSPGVMNRVAAMALVDVGWSYDLSPTAYGQIALYQTWLAAACRVGGIVGDIMATLGPHRLLFGTPPALRHGGSGSVSAESAYHYVLALRDAASGSPLKPPAPPEGVPCFFSYGSEKPFAFHSEQMLRDVRARPASRVVEYECGHWVPTDARGFTSDLEAWLEEVPGSAKASDRRTTP